jgi:hypothetical protein
MKTALCAVLALVVIPWGGAGHLSGASTQPDLLLLNAHVVTMDQVRPVAQAIAIQGDRFAWVMQLGHQNQDPALEGVDVSNE